MVNAGQVWRLVAKITLAVHVKLVTDLNAHMQASLVKPGVTQNAMVKMTTGFVFDRIAIVP